MRWGEDGRRDCYLLALSAAEGQWDAYWHPDPNLTDGIPTEVLPHQLTRLRLRPPRCKGDGSGRAYRGYA